MKKEITFLVNEAEEGGYYAEAIGYGIFAEGDSIDELNQNIRSVIAILITLPKLRCLPIYTLLKMKLWLYESTPQLGQMQNL